MKVVIKDYPILKAIYGSDINMPGGWHPSMVRCCGKQGVATKHDTRRHIYYIKGNRWIWHKDALIFLEDV